MLFSVVIPVYNGEKYLGECLDSVEAQGFGGFEGVVADGASVLSPGPYDGRRYGVVRVSELPARMSNCCNWGVRKRRFQGRTCR